MMRNLSIEDGTEDKAGSFLRKTLRALLSRAGRVFAGFGVKNHSDMESALRIEEKLSLGPKKMLYLVHCKGRELLVAAGADSIVSMMELSAESLSDRTKVNPRAEVNPVKPLTRLEKRTRLS
jgi:flagellar biogenesis protein FliO